MQFGRKKILQVGGLYIAGIFSAYFLIGLGLLQVLHLFNTPHFMGRVGAALLIAFGIINIINRFFPEFPLKLKIPNVAHGAMGKLLERTSLAAAFGLGILVGICQFPCMGGPYLMVIGLLKDQVTYVKGFGYLLMYNLILIVPLIAVLVIAADKILLQKVQEWKKTNMNAVRLYSGIAMILVGLLVLLM
jgi:cytochrome c biogenesis protein CcdA